MYAIMFQLIFCTEGWSLRQRRF